MALVQALFTEQVTFTGSGETSFGDHHSTGGQGGHKESRYEATTVLQVSGNSGRDQTGKSRAETGLGGTRRWNGRT